MPQQAGGFLVRPAITDLLAGGPAGETGGSKRDSCWILTGLGGVGKTQAAAYHAHRAWINTSVDLLLWITAGSREAIVQGYASAAIDLIASDHRTSLPDAAAWFLGWLAQTSIRWMVVLDDLADPADLAGLWPPVDGHGTSIITTRRQDSALTGRRRRLVTVGAFSPKEATEFLVRQLDGADPRDADAVAGDLGHLPLALAQAATYMRDRHLDCAAYHRRLGDRRHRLDELMPEPGALPDGHRTNLAAAWSLSIEAADRLTPAGVARPVLALVAMLDPNAIPTAVFATAAAVSYVSRRLDRRVTADDLLDGLHCLRRLNLATIDRDTVSVHAMVQRAVRETEDLPALSRAAADALSQVWPRLGRHVASAGLLRAAVAALRCHAEDHLWTPQPHPVMLLSGCSLLAVGLAAQAADYLDKLHKETEKRLGSLSPDTLTVAHHLGTARSSANQRDAIASLLDVLKRRTAVLGEFHPDTLLTRSRVVRWEIEHGELPRGANDLRSLLAEQIRRLGPEDPEVLSNRHMLAAAICELGDPNRAELALRRLLNDCLRIFGPAHDQTLGVRMSLACARAAGGDPKGAIIDLTTLHPERARLLGTDHIDAMAVRYNLIASYNRIGRPDVAGAERLVADVTRAIGPAHRATLNTRCALAVSRGEADGPEPALIDLEALVKDQGEVLAPDHPYSLVTRAELARNRLAAGDHRGVSDLAALLPDLVRVLGARNKITDWARRNLRY